MSLNGAMSDPMTTLHRGVGPVNADHYLAAEPAHVMWGRLPCANDRAVLRVEPGAEVTIDTVSHEGLLPDQGSDPVAYFGSHGIAPENVLDDAIEIARTVDRRDNDGPHVVTGPIAVTGAEPGDLLAITLLDTTPRVPYGVISNRHGKGALPGELPRGNHNVSVFTPVGDAADGTPRGLLPTTEGGHRRVEFPLAPFLGIMGVAAASPERPHSVPPGEYGGNIDIRRLVTGSTLYLPVQVPEALAYVGDPHFAQGDGEVALTALEASLRVTAQFDVIPQADALEAFGLVTGPLGRADGYLMPTGMDRDLNEAMRSCVRASLSLIHARWGMDEHLAYAYLSAATDFNISQVVDVVTGVHARIRESDFGRVDP